MSERNKKAQTITQASELLERSQDPEGFESYNAICKWLEANLGIKANYKTVHSLVYYRLQASPKIVRPQSSEQSKEPRGDGVTR